MSETANQVFGFISNPDVVKKLHGSEERIKRAFTELMSGYNLTGADVLNDVVHVENYTGIVAMKSINFYSFCEHHFAPFFGTADVYYEPDKIITGLGKLVRLVHDVHARRLQIQELMTRDIANDLMTVLKAKGAFVRTSAKHMCICSRGPKDDNTYTECTFGAGSLEHWYKNQF